MADLKDNGTSPYRASDKMADLKDNGTSPGRASDKMADLKDNGTSPDPVSDKMADPKDSETAPDRPSSNKSSSSRLSQDTEDQRDTCSELPSPSSSRLSNYSEMSTASSRTFYPPPGYPNPAINMSPGYPPNGYPDSGYPIRNLYPSAYFPATGRYPSGDFPRSTYPNSPPPSSPYPKQEYPETRYKPLSDYSGSEATSLVFSEDLDMSRASSEMLYPMSTFPASGSYPNLRDTNSQGELPDRVDP
ncbi:adhesive plaque matrix protein-like [Haliotis rubra]|uniref:adhesive plaque matrix protein-like n=1 Tax=Haliotis rubra TaxID=36100 RepID=UPI001EE58069|nr:adhesive plaque matrix protein-like [Haliotis rubra]